MFSLFNTKIKLGVVGRNNTFSSLKRSISSTDKTIWMHCASLGEYEQGLPVLQQLRKTYPEHKIVVSFFSPSGYENKKDSKDFDVAIYLPLDLPKNAKRFLDIINPELILFVKYEVWPNVLLEAKKRNIKAVLFSATFRKNQSYFKWYGRFMRKALFSFEHIFTQDENSKQLIESIGCKSVSVSGDTRFDRVSKQLEMDNSVDFIETFIDGKTTIVFGSSWPADDALFIPFINNYKSDDVKFIIAPHNVKLNYTQRLKEQLNVKSVSFSGMKGKSLSDYNVFILDTIGYLNKVYSYADVAYVGGAAGTTGLHNILEPAVFGIPLIIGRNYNKFPEAKALIELGGVMVVTSSEDFERKIENLLTSSQTRSQIGKINSNFIADNRNATKIITNHLNE